MGLEAFDRDRERARDARREAKELRELHKVATCGLAMKYTGIHYGTAHVPTRYAARIADLYLTWADEYDAIAEGIEADLEAAIREQVK